MGLKLLNHVKALPGFTPAEKSVLKELADLSRDDQTVFVGLEKLSLNTSYSVRSLQYTLHKLEQKQAIILQCEARGRGNAHSYEFNVGFNGPVESAPVVPPEYIPPPTNGHKPRDPYKPEPLTPEQIAARRAQWGAKRAEIAAKPRPEKKYDRPGRTERESTRMVQGRASLDGYPGGDASP